MSLKLNKAQRERLRAIAHHLGHVDMPIVRIRAVLAEASR